MQVPWQRPEGAETIVVASAPSVLVQRRSPPRPRGNHPQAAV